LTLERLSVLQTVERLRPVSVADLAASEAVHPSTMSRMVSGLTRQRLIRRLADQSDGRGSLIVSTSQGKSVAKRALRSIMRDLVAAVSKLNARERAELEHALSLVERLVIPARPGR
jgi:DNA-binding MarR family transcriptional regulator